MAQDISGVGTIIRLTASKTFPAGIAITDYSDDADPIRIAGINIADGAMTLNGTLAKWNRAVPVPVTLTVLPGTNNDQALSTIGDNNRVAQNKQSVNDSISLVIIYPDGQVVTLTGGIMTGYDPGRSISSAGRQVTKTYNFLFENKI